jgi:3-phenylpropionate/trans-cinnamate dioxygenase ferredoxin reductase subunit
MLGRDEPFDRVPYFFSDQYDLGMEYAGYPVQSDRVVYRGDPSTFEFIAFWMQGDRVVAAMNANVWDVTDHLQALIRERRPVTDQQLRDPDVPLDRLGG